MIVYDLLGWTFPNVRLLADHYARQANVTVYVPDFFGGYVVPFEPVLAGRFDLINLASSMKNNSREIREPENFACAKALRQKSYKKVGAIGFCYGGWAVFRLGAKEYQPTLIDFPVQILAPEIDQLYTPEMKQFTFETVPKLGLPLDYQYFPGVKHGSFVRDAEKPGERDAMVRAKNAARRRQHRISNNGASTSPSLSNVCLPLTTSIHGYNLQTTSGISIQIGVLCGIYCNYRKKITIPTLHHRSLAMTTRTSSTTLHAPKTTSNTRPSRTKRSIDDSPSSPVHPSKRSKLSPTSNHSHNKINSPRAKGTPNRAEIGDTAATAEVEHPETITVKEKSVHILKRGSKRKVASPELEEYAIEGDEEEEIEIKAKKQTKKTKVKEEVTIDMRPLAPRTANLRMYVGAHISAAKGVQNAVTNSVHIGGNAFALFLKSQRKWDNPPLQPEHRDQFRQLCAEHNYDASKHVLPHGSYLVNLAQEDPTKATQAYNSFLDDLKRCEELGISLYNFHPGATIQTTLESSLSRLSKALTSALDATTKVILVLETMCGHGTTIGGSLSDFKSLLSLIPDSYHARIGICVDTCHSFAAGYDLRSPGAWNKFMKEFDEEIGLKFLRALHLNDSKTPLGSRRDLHANIGTGFLGLRAFHNVMNEKRLEGIPMILETPIDRPANIEAETASGQPDNKFGVCKEDHSIPTPTTKKTGGAKKGPARKQKPSKPAMIEDKSVWAKEIKLLESLIGMDVESKEFLRLEAELAEQGREEREKHQAMFDKKQEKESKQRDLRDMFGANGKGKGKGKANTTGARKRKKTVNMESSDDSD
ncbi:hypothetical protein GX48_05391 [Paracoccidioides brasiliensis]|nr:hypothetical protein GX48_05391 [Paracoccidioides brasiliensis]